MPIRSEIESEFAWRLVDAMNMNNAAAIIGKEISEITHSDGKSLTLVEKIEIADAIRTRLVDGSAFKRRYESVGELAKLSFTLATREQLLEVIESVIQIILHQLQ
jgi:hypothetical protein